MTTDQDKDKAVHADTLENGSNVPVNAGAGGSGNAEPGGQFVGAHGGTDASAAAQTSGSSGASPGHGMRQQNDGEGVPGTAGGNLAAGGGSPGAGAVGGTGLGEFNTADDTRGASCNRPTGTALGGDRSGGEAGGPTPSGTPAP